MGRPTKIKMEELLERSMTLFWERGVDAVTTRDLEAELELRAPAIYRRFASKEALFARAVEHYVDTILVERIRTVFEGADDPVAALHAYFLAAIAPRDREDRLLGCLLVNTATHADGQIPEVRAALLRGLFLVNEAFTREVMRAQEAGRLDTALDPSAVSQALLMSLQGLLTLVRAGVTDLGPGIDATFRMVGGVPAAAPDER